MSRVARLVLVLGFLLALLPTAASAQTLPPNCEMPQSPSGSFWLICAPTTTPNNDLVVFAHGYVPPGAPLTSAFDQLILDKTTTPPTTIPGLVNSMGYYFAASTYPQSGLAVTDGLLDTKAMVDAVKAALYAKNGVILNHVYLVGASEGGLVATLGVERFPGTFSGGLATCGPIGDFRGQVNYFGDFRVVFDYFFPGLLPPSPVSIPAGLMANWTSGLNYSAQVAGAMAASPAKTSQLIKVTKAAIDPSKPSTAIDTAEAILWYNVFSTNDAIAKLGGQPFGNQYRWYFGSTNDRLLNRMVQRFTASPTALRSIAAYYQTSGRLQKPLVTMHTTGDPVVPYWHEPLYTAKTLLTGSAKMHVNIPVVAYGHCNFTTEQTLGAFGLLVYKVTGQLPPAMSVQAALPSATSRAAYSAFVENIRALK